MLDQGLPASVFRRLPIPAYLLAIDDDWTVLAVNDAFVRIIGRRAEDMVGRPLFELFPADPSDRTDDGESVLRRSLQLTRATGREQALPVQRYPIGRLQADGRIEYEERFWSAVNTPIPDAAGGLQSILHTTIEVTQQVHAEAALRRSEQQAREAAHRAEAERQRLDAVLQAVPIGIAVGGEDGRLLLTNAAHRQLWGERQPPVQGIADFAAWRGWWADGSERHGRPLAPHEWTTARVLQGLDASHDVIEIESFDPPHAHRVCLNSGAPVVDEHGRIVGAVVAQMDITHQVRTEQLLKQADQRKDEFLAMLAHELRNPLAPIRAAADLLALGRLSPDQIRQTGDIIMRQVRHMTELVDDLLDVSRVTRGLITLERHPVDLKRIVAEAHEQTRPLMEARGHGVTLRSPPEPALVMGDAKRLIQILTNLLSNAAKYTPEGGDIVVDLRFADGFVQVDVEDNGIGMNGELVHHAFELFTQAKRSADRSLGGLGIGLALVRRLVELHGGSIRAHSEGPGRGSRFTVCLPRLQARAGNEHVQPTPTLEPAARQVTVMVVDDNVDAARMLALLVEAVGHAAVVEHRPEQAIESARVVRPQVFLLDIGLPGMDGHQLVRHLRADPATADAVMVAVTGYGQDRDRETALASGFDHHFVKPVDAERLVSLLKRVEEDTSTSPGADASTVHTPPGSGLDSARARH